MADFAADPDRLAGSAANWAGLGRGLEGLGEAAAAALEGMADAAGDAGLAGALRDAAASALASLSDISLHATAFGPALVSTADNYERSDRSSAAGLRAPR